MMTRALVVIGTRPEAIKLGPVVSALAGRPGVRVVVGLTGQHDRELTHALSHFRIRPDFDLELVRTRRNLWDLTGAIISGMGLAMSEARPDVVVVQGDTVTAFGAALAAYYHHIPVAHVEAGLRTGRRDEPFPEEVNRRLTDRVSDLYFAPTEGNRRNLLAEGVAPSRVAVTGNTVVDAVETFRRTPRFREFIPPGPPDRRLVLVTVHRRESIGAPMRAIFGAIRELARTHPEAHVVYPVHPNPHVQTTARRVLGGVPGISLVDPVDYVAFLALMARAHLILTDSGGVQEEAPSFGVPVLVLRAVTERQELVEAGGARLVGADPDRILGEASRLIRDPDHHRRMRLDANPFGDGRAAGRIAETLVSIFERDPDETVTLPDDVTSPDAGPPPGDAAHPVDAAFPEDVRAPETGNE